MTTEMLAYAIRQAGIRARLLVATAGLPNHQSEDLQQDLLLDYLRRASRFDPGRGTWPGFVGGVLRNQATVLVKRRCRQAHHEIPAGDFRDIVLQAVGCENVAFAIETKVDVREVLRQLPESLQALASLLPETPIAEVCFAIKKSRSRVYQMVGELRSAFCEAGYGTVRAPARESRRRARSSAAHRF